MSEVWVSPQDVSASANLREILIKISNSAGILTRPEAQNFSDESVILH